MYIYLIIFFLFGLSGYLWRGKNHLAHQLEQCGNAVPMREFGRRYRELFENTSDAIFVIEVTGSGQLGFDSFNSAAAQIIDPDRVGFERRSFNEILKRYADTELQRIVLELSAHLRRAIDSGMPVKYESTFNFSSKDLPGIYEISLVPMADDSGIGHILCFAKDVTAIKLYEQELLVRVRLEEKLSGFATSAPGFFYSFLHGADGSNCMPFASDGINDLFGLRPEDVAQNISPMSLLIHRDDLKSFIDATAISAADISPLAIEFRTQHPDKGELWVASRAMPLALHDGSVLWHGFMHDITDKKLTELRLKDTQDKLRKLVLSREAVREDERKRVAWEMHEELGQLLAAMKMRVYGMRTRLPGDIPSLGEDSRVIGSLIDKSIKTIHDLVTELRPSVLLHGLGASLEWLVAEFKNKSGLNCQLEIKEDVALVSEELTTLVFRAVQEILEDIARHSGVSRVVVTWVNNQRQQVLRIRHDGDVITNDKSLSLFGIQERVSAFGGEMKIFSDLEYGSVIEMSFPVPGVSEN